MTAVESHIDFFRRALNSLDLTREFGQSKYFQSMSRVKPSGRSAVPPQSKASSTPSTRSVSHSVVDSPARPLASIDVYEQLKCASCMCPFDLNQRYPKLLGCTHSVCLQCLQFASQQVESIHCPYCDAVTPLPSLDEVHELLDNFFVCDLIDRTAPSSSSKSFQRASSAGPKGAAYDNDDDHVDHDEFLDRDSEADMEHQRRISQINTKCSNHDEDLKYVCNLCQVCCFSDDHSRKFEARNSLINLPIILSGSRLRVVHRHD
jgi:hypothetical protein